MCRCFHKISKHLSLRCDYETGASVVVVTWASLWVEKVPLSRHIIWTHYVQHEWTRLVRQACSFSKVRFCWGSCFLFITEALRSGSQTSRPSAPSGVDMSACVPPSLSLQCVMNRSVSCLIGNNNRNCKLRILPDCHIGIWNIIYTVWEYVISFVFQRWVFPLIYIQSLT